MPELEFNVVSEEFITDVRALKQALNGGAAIPNNQRQQLPPPPRDGIRVFNTSSTDTIGAYGIMACVDSNATASPDVLNIATPSTTFYRTYLVNGPVAIQPSGFGWAQPGPLVRVAYDSGTPANGEGWGPKPSQSTISKSYPDTCTIQGVYDSSNKIAIALLHEISDFFGKPSGSISTRSSGTINLYSGAFGSESVISSYTLSAFNISTSTAVTSSDWVVGTWINGQAVFSKAC